LEMVQEEERGERDIYSETLLGSHIWPVTLKLTSGFEIFPTLIPRPPPEM